MPFAKDAHSRGVQDLNEAMRISNKKMARHSAPIFDSSPIDYILSPENADFMRDVANELGVHVEVSEVKDGMRVFIQFETSEQKDNFYNMVGEKRKKKN